MPSLAARRSSRRTARRRQVVLERGHDPVGGHAGRRGEALEHLPVADVLAAAPVRREQVQAEALLQLLDDRLVALSLLLLASVLGAFSGLDERAGEQPVRDEGVGPAGQLVQADERQTVRGRGLRQVAGHPVGGAGAVLALDVLAPADPLCRDGRVELERGEAPGEALRLVAEVLERGEPARRADVTPRSDDVRPEHDLDHAFSPSAVEARAGSRAGLVPGAAPRAGSCR